MKTQVFQIMSKFFSQRTQRHGARGVIFIALLAVVILAGCPTEPPVHEDTGFIPIGEWIGPDDYGDPDKYIITETKVTYVDLYSYNNFTGEIITAIDFSNDSGVIIIQILDDPIPDTYTSGKYTCIYYKDYTANQVLLASPFDIIEMKYIEVKTINDAKNTFTIDNVGDHVGFWGSYTK